MTNTPENPIKGECKNCGINLYADKTYTDANGEVKTGPYPKTMPCNVPGCPFEKPETQDRNIDVDYLEAWKPDGGNYA